MPTKIDRETVFQMLRTGFTVKAIAKRMKCSSRQIGRIKKEIEQVKNIQFKKNTNLKDPEIEKALRDFYLKMESPEKTAKRFGVTKQALIK